MRCVAAGDGARLISRLDTGIVAEPAHAIITRDSPEAVIDPFERVNQSRPRRDWAGAQRPCSEAVPPDIGFGKRANRGAGQAAAPVIVHIRPQLVAGEPINLVFLDAVVNDLIAERNAVGGTSVSAFPANLTKIFDGVIDRLIGYQRKIGQDRIGHVDARAVSLVDDQPVSPEFADSRSDAGGLWRTDAAQRRVAQFFDVALQSF